MKSKLSIARLLVLLLVLMLTCSGSAAAQLSHGSQLSVLGSAQIVEGSTQLLADGSQWLVTSVSVVAEKTVVVLRHMGSGIQIVLEHAVLSAGTVSLAAGQTLQVVSHTTGLLFMQAGKLVAYVPTELGTSLIHQSKH